MEKTERTVYLDYLRVFATVAVMLLHVAAQYWDSVDVNGFDWKVFNFYDSFSRWGVDVFLMMSGVLFLSREEVQVKKIYTKYVSRMLIAYFTWSFIYYLFSGENIGNQLYLLFCRCDADAIVTVIKGHFHLWFVLIISGVYICLPIIRQITKNEKVTVYFLLLTFIFYCLIPEIISVLKDFAGGQLPLVEALDEFIRKLRLSLVMNLASFTILGYELSKHTFSKKTRIAIYILGLTGCLFTFTMTQLVSVMKGNPTEAYYRNMTVNVLFAAIAVFELFKNSSFENAKLNKFMATLSKWSFGAYLVHPLFMEQFNKIGFGTTAFCPVMSVPVIAITVFVCSFAVSGVLHCIPVLKKYIV